MYSVELYGILFLQLQDCEEALRPERRRLALYRHLGTRPSEKFFLESRLPRRPKGGKGGFTMTFEQVVLLLTLLGGAIYATFEITWTVSHDNDHSDDKKKK